MRPPAPRPAILRPLSPTRYQITVTVPAETHAKLLRARDLLRHAIPGGDAALILDRALTVLLGQLEKAKFGALAERRAGATAADSPQHPAPVSSRRTKRPNSKPANPTESRATVQKQDATPDDVVACGSSLGPSEVRGGQMDTSAISWPSAAVDSQPGVSRRSRHIPAAVRRAVWARSEGCCEFVSDDGQRCRARALLEFHHRVPFAAGGVSSVTNVRILCKAHNDHEAESFFGIGHMAAQVSSRRCAHAEQRTATGQVVSPSPATVNSRRDSG